jgi:hypothetical protein
MVWKNHRTTAAQVSAELSIHLEDPVSMKTVRHKLHKSNIYDRAAIAKSLITESNAHVHKLWCHDHKTWTSDNWKHAHDIATLFHTSGRVYVWRTPKEVYNMECLVPTVKHEGGCVMVWVAISWYNTVGPIITLHGRITAREYVDRLGNQVHPMIQTLFSNNTVFQGANAPIHTAGTVQSWFKEQEGELQHLLWPANHQI